MAKAKRSTDNGNDSDDLTEFHYTLMCLLANEPTYGLGVKKSLQKYYGDEVNHGRLYPNLDELVERDLLAKDKIDNRTNEYILTDRGLAEAVDRIAWAVDQLVPDEERAAVLIDELERSVIPDHA